MMKSGMSENEFMNAMWLIAKKKENYNIIIEDGKYLILDARAMYGSDIQLSVHGANNTGYRVFECLADLYQIYIEKRLAIVPAS